MVRGWCVYVLDLGGLQGNGLAWSNIRLDLPGLLSLAPSCMALPLAYSGPLPSLCDFSAGHAETFHLWEEPP